MLLVAVSHSQRNASWPPSEGLCRGSSLPPPLPRAKVISRYSVTLRLTSRTCCHHPPHPAQKNAQISGSRLSSKAILKTRWEANDQIQACGAVGETVSVHLVTARIAFFLLPVRPMVFFFLRRRRQRLRRWLTTCHQRRCYTFFFFG